MFAFSGGGSRTFADAVVGLNLTNLAVECTLVVDAKMSTLFHPSFSGKVDATLKNIDASVSADLDFAPVEGFPQYTVPVASHSHGCGLSMDIDLKFSGGILPDLLNLLKKTLENLIEKVHIHMHTRTHAHTHTVEMLVFHDCVKRDLAGMETDAHFNGIGI